MKSLCKYIIESIFDKDLSEKSIDGKIDDYNIIENLLINPFLAELKLKTFKDPGQKYDQYAVVEPLETIGFGLQIYQEKCNVCFCPNINEPKKYFNLSFLFRYESDLECFYLSQIVLTYSDGKMSGITLNGFPFAEASSYKRFKSCIDKKLDLNGNLLITTNNIEKIKNSLIKLCDEFFDVMNTYKEEAIRILDNRGIRFYIMNLIRKIKKIFN